MVQIILAVHVLIALGIIGLIMLQQGKGADMGASFGAGGSQTVFGGAGGGNILSQATAVLAVAFFATSIALAVVARDEAARVGGVELPMVEEVIEEERAFDEPPATDEVPDFDAPVSAPASDSEIPES